MISEGMPRISGCSSGGRTLDWGSRGRKFESCHSDFFIAFQAGQDYYIRAGQDYYIQAGQDYYIRAGQDYYIRA